MDVFILKEPAEISFTGNPMPYTISLSPYGTLEKTQDIRIVVMVQVEILLDSNAFTEAVTEQFYPDDNGMVSFDIKTVIDAYLDYYTPSPDLNKPVQAVNQRKRYRINYLVQKDGDPVTSTKQSTILIAIKGGMSFGDWHPSNFFNIVVLKQKKPLNFILDREQVRLDDKRFIFWLYPFENVYDQYIFVKVKLDNGDEVLYTHPSSIFTNRWSICCAPAGFNMLNLASILPEGTMAVSYTITIATDDLVVVAPVTFTIDHRNFYDSRQLVYRNSMGAMETIHLTGELSFEGSYTKQYAQRVVPASYFEEKSILFNKNITADVEEQSKVLGTTGFLSRSSSDKLRDLFISKQVYEYYNGRLVPVTITNTSAKFYTNKQQSMIGVDVEWQRPTSSYYTPDYLMKDLPVDDMQSCPAVADFRILKTATYQLQIWWGLQTPYDKIQVEVMVEPTFSTVAPDKVFSYTFSGNTGTQVLSFNTILLTLVYAGAFFAGKISARARTICDDTTDPISVGPWKNVNLSNENVNLPVAVDDNYSINGGFNTAQVLAGSVMANDYDSNSSSIEVVAAGGSTTAGGTYAITSAGIITYTPPNSAYTGTDTFTYQLRRVGETGTVSAKVNIKVGTTQSVILFYVKIAYRNTNIVKGRSFNESSGEIWMEFYKDAAGTTPINISAFAKQISYSKTTREQPQLKPLIETSEFLSVLGIGTSMKLYQGIYYSQAFGSSMPSSMFRIDFTIMPENYYAII